jgi:hypothetical protein
MCLPFHRKMNAICLVVAVVDNATDMNTREHTEPTDAGEDANTGTTLVNDTALTLPVLPTETTVAIDSMAIMEELTVAIDSMAIVEELYSYNPVLVTMAIQKILESMETMLPQDLVALLTAGLCHAIVLAMNHHGDVMGLQFNACVLLTNLAFKSDDIAASIVQSGGDVAIVHFMKRFPMEAEFQHLACVTLNNLLVTTNEDGGRYGAVVAAGGIPALIAAIDNNPGDTKIGLFACFGLSKLTDSSLYNTNVAVEHGAIETVAGVISASQAANDDRLEELAVILIMRFLRQHEQENAPPAIELPRAVHAANE